MKLREEDSEFTRSVDPMSFRLASGNSTKTGLIKEEEERIKEGGERRYLCYHNNVLVGHRSSKMLYIKRLS